MYDRSLTLQKVSSLSSAKFKNLLGISKESFLLLNTELEDNIEVLHLIWTLHFLRHYPTEYEAEYEWDVDFKTWRKYVFETIALSEALNTVRIPDRRKPKKKKEFIQKKF